jgi:hypothetical protein
LFLSRVGVEDLELLQVEEVVVVQGVVLVEGRAAGLLVVIDFLLRVVAIRIMHEILLVKKHELVVFLAVGLVDIEELLRVVFGLQVVEVLVHKVVEFRRVSV